MVIVQVAGHELKEVAMRDADNQVCGEQRLGGMAALYLATAYLVAIPYFLAVVKYQEATDPVSKFALLVTHAGSLKVFTYISYIIFGMVLAALSLVLHDRFKDQALVHARLVAVWGLIWACLLVANGMIYCVGMDHVLGLHSVDPAGALASWGTIEAVVNGLGGAGGEILGGPWVIVASIAGIRSRTFPRWIATLGIFSGLLGLLSVLPPVRETAQLFGITQILWLAGLGIHLLRSGLTAGKMSGT